MSTFVETQHSRARSGTFTAKVPTPSDLTLTPVNPPFLDRERLTPAEKRKLDEHLATAAPDGRSWAEVYTAFGIVESVKLGIVHGRRGSAAQLLWRLNGAEGGTVDVPAFVAKACLAPDISDPIDALRHRRNRAWAAKEKATEERARLAGRVRGPRYADLMERERVAGEALAVAEAALASAM